MISACSYSDTAGFHTEGEGLEFPPPPPPPPPEILKLSMVIIVVPSVLANQFYILLDISMCHQNVRKVCPRLCQKQSERI